MTRVINRKFVVVSPSQIVFQGRDYNLAEMDRNSTEELLFQVNAELQRMKQQIDDAKSKAYDKGVYADSDWFRAVQRAQRSLALVQQVVQTNLGRKPRNRSDATSVTLADMFMESAKFFLQPEAFDTIMSAAQDKLESRLLEPGRQ